MKKLISVALLGACLSGCVYQSVDNHEINMAQRWCTDKGGIKNIESTFIGTVLVTCNGRFVDKRGNTRFHYADMDTIEREFLKE